MWFLLSCSETAATVIARLLASTHSALVDGCRQYRERDVKCATLTVAHPGCPVMSPALNMSSFAVLCALMAGLCLSSGARADLPAVIDTVRPSIVGVGTTYPARQPIGGARPSQLLGTGFAVGNGSIVATNYHVVPKILDYENRQALAVFVGRGASARARAAEVVAEDREHDLALLRIEGDPLPPLALGDAKGVREGEMMVFTGFPIGAVLGLFPVSHRGIVSSITPAARTADNAADLSPAQLRRMRNPFNVFQLDAIAYPGNSGSPVYRENSGEVIGVLNSVYVKESREAILERPSGISYAIPVDWLKTLLGSLEPSSR